MSEYTELEGTQGMPDTVEHRNEKDIIDEDRSIDMGTSLQHENFLRQKARNEAAYSHGTTTHNQMKEPPVVAPDVHDPGLFK